MTSKKSVLLALCCIPFFTTAKTKITCNSNKPQVKCTVRISEEDKLKMSNMIQDISLNFPQEIRLLQNDQIDLSGFVTEINKTANTYYDNRMGFVKIKNLLFKNYVLDLCDKSTDPKDCKSRTRFKSDFSLAIDTINKNKENKILYPRGYLAVGSLKEEDFKNTLELLDACKVNCISGNLTRGVRFGSQKQYAVLFSKIKEQNKDCLRNLLKDISFKLTQESVPKACLKEENKTHTVCKNILEDGQTIKKRIDDLMALAFSSLQLTEAKTLCIDCLKEDETHNWIQLKELLDHLNREETCLDINPGEEKQVSFFTPVNYTVKQAGGEDKVVSMLEQENYILKRDSEGTYHINFPVEFFADADYNGETPINKVPTVYRQRVEKCLKQANSMMLNSKTGSEKIQLSISTIPTCSKQRQSHASRIAIGSSDFRAHYKKYPANIDCPTITHEILHLAGLCDEYQDTFTGWYVNPETGDILSSNQKKGPSYTNYDFKLKYDCRMVTENSIMSNQHERWDYAEKNQASLLSPGHFNSLLYGSCESKNKSYLDCSLLAYKSSFKDDSCLAKKTQCEKNNVLKQDKQEQIDFLEERLQLYPQAINYFNQEIENLKHNATADLNITKAENKLKESLDYYKQRLQETKQQLERVRAWPD